jgi:hypothetical protein
MEGREMKKVLLLGVCLFVVASSGIAYAEMPSMKVMDLAKTTLADIGKDPVIVKAVADDNAKMESMADIEAMDTKWKAEEGVADYMEALMENDCAKHLKEIVAQHAFLVEIFVMDNQGANVCQTDKTGDYWQGDEAKFKKSYMDGKGEVFVDEVEYDDGMKANISQVSVPVMDMGKAIGAITFGVNVDKVM